MITPEQEMLPKQWCVEHTIVWVAILAGSQTTLQNFTVTAVWVLKHYGDNEHLENHIFLQINHNQNSNVIATICTKGLSGNNISSISQLSLSIVEK